MIFDLVNKNRLLNKCFHRLEYDNVLKILSDLKIEEVSVFEDFGDRYVFLDVIETKDVKSYVSNLIYKKESLMFFDGIVKHCDIDKEIEVLSSRLLFVEYDIGENETHVIVNTKNIGGNIDLI